MSIDTTDVILAGLGIGGFLWMNNKLNVERRARTAAEHQRDCARVCAGARAERPANNRTGPAASSRGLAPRTFDSIFATYGQGLPVPYLRALALRESNMNPRETSGPAWGLMQVIEVVRQDYNQRTGAKYTRQDLLDPAVNVTIAASALASIVRSYAQNHPRIKNLQANWSNPRFIELLTFGWNAGWSERGGVGRVSTYLEQRGALEQTIDTIHQAARAAGASPHLSNAAKVGWSKSVAAQYLKELAAMERPHGQVIEMPEDYVGRPPHIEMPEDYVGRPPFVATGPITQPSQVMTSGPIMSPSQAMTSGPVTSPSQVASGSSLVAPFPVAPPVPASSAHASVSGLSPSTDTRAPIDPYADCACPT